MIEGLARTAGLITSAAAIIIAVFAAFTLGSFLVVQMLGFTLAVAVFIDATAVRTIVGPHYCNLPATGIGGPLACMGPRQRLKRSLSHEVNTVDARVIAQASQQPN